jgi:peptidoglycan/LPS O-acetylase OafA/YrhL
MQSVTTKCAQYYPQLDGLRAIAVCMVIYSHWAGYHGTLWADDSSWFNGETGVQLFFVISGFLITGILLDEKTKGEAAHVSKLHLIKTFYIRRFLRIFPAFYATLAVTYLLGHPDVRASVWWHLTYLSNFFFAWRGDYLGDVSHLWSLAVEEQFYLVWPFLMCAIPDRYLKSFIIGCILIAPVFRYCLEFFVGANDTTVNVMPFSSLDALSAGALLAWLKREHGSQKYERYTPVLASLSLGLWLIVIYAPPMTDTFYAPIVFLKRLLLIPLLFFVVVLVSNRINGIGGKILEWRPLLFIGKISYGIYLFHFFIPWVVIALCATLGIQLGENVSYPLFLVLNSITLVVISSLSWLLFESKLNNLKRYFKYDKPDTSKSYYFNLHYLKLLFYRK